MEKEIKIDLVRCFKAVIQRWWIIAISALLLFGITLIITNGRLSESYTAQSTVYSAVYGNTEQSLAGLDIMQTYSEIIQSRKVADRAALLLGEEGLTGDIIQGMISSSYTDTSAVLYIYATSEDSQLAVSVANAIAESFVIEAQNITGDNTIQVLDKSVSASADGMSKKILYCMLAFLAGAFIPFMFIVFREIFSDSIYHVADATLDGEIPVIGIIPSYDKM